LTNRGHPSEYLKKYSVASTLSGHGIKVVKAEGEDLDSLYTGMCEAINTPGPAAVIVHRPMAPGIKGIEGSPHAHDAVKVFVSFLFSRHDLTPDCSAGNPPSHTSIPVILVAPISSVLSSPP
jgi:hypothetical protein